ncbi:septal ring lytic transglycosylase RlpA family protein [Paraburkholderia phymatum]|uniref:Endolytic peptidoglycan transglycosylase RlpA n=1 Tax=Paraburkholderia phymatum (strain DSM 17167 / CIP 108236 / LMG 21445 / STM815) TaxID=391038 RepID=B2JMJ4_PARP8|nr:septal ring lytic transglycosylase RlpA family protein [Paraburkholderia phymatum]ACC72788.1 rare lipoprotein A [Paraburkholderia phymatum STM815]
MSSLRIVGLLAIFGLCTGCAQIHQELQASNPTNTVAMPSKLAVTDGVSDETPLTSGHIAVQPKSGALQTGYASWYARKFQGRRTASGERYDNRLLTAAHRTLPLGSYVRVTSLATEKSVVVRVNDRGPFIKGRIIDLSLAAASELGLTRSPSMQVELQRVEKAANSRALSDGSES